MGAKRFIVVAGNIGSGKTTLTQMLSEKFGWEPHFEARKNNPYLSDFYGDMSRWSLPLQVFFLSKRFQAHRAILDGAHSAIQDRSIYEDAHIFARGLHESGKMDRRDFENYLELYHSMVPFLTPPDLVIYIRRSVDCLIQRIAERGFDYERGISADYLSLLDRCYSDWIKGYRHGKVLTIEANNLDLKWRREDFDYVCSKIELSLEQPELFSVC